VGLQLLAPGVPDTGATRESGPAEALVVGQPCAGCCRRLPQGLGRGAWIRAQQGPQGLRARAGEEAVRPRAWLGAVVRTPLGSCLQLALGPGPAATRTMAAVLCLTALALREAGGGRAALALGAGADDLAGSEGERGVVLQIRGRTGGAELAEGGHGGRPCMRVGRRAEASAGP